jgi:hypothetical protein
VDGDVKNNSLHGTRGVSMDLWYAQKLVLEEMYAKLLLSMSFKFDEYWNIIGGS